MNRKWIIPALAAAAAGALAFGVARHVACRGAGTALNDLQNISHLALSLGLSEAQAREIKAMHASLGAKLNDCCMRHCAARARLGHALASETNGAGQTEAVLVEMCRAYEQSERATLDHIRQVRAVLSMEQRKRFDTMITDYMCRTCSMHGGAACPTVREAGPNFDAMEM
jgi:hypothetical protein